MEWMKYISSFSIFEFVSLPSFYFSNSPLVVYFFLHLFLLLSSRLINGQPVALPFIFLLFSCLFFYKTQFSSLFSFQTLTLSQFILLQILPIDILFLYSPFLTQMNFHLLTCSSQFISRLMVVLEGISIRTEYINRSY